MIVQTGIQEILKKAVDLGASDVHIKAGVAPTFRISRELQLETGFPVCTDEDTRRFFSEITSNEQREVFYREWELDFAYTAEGIGRFRVNAYFHLGTLSLVFRWVRAEVPTLDKLGLPPICQDLALKADGLVILTGPTGCGKSTTLAAMLDYMNTKIKRNIITIEDPVEFLHQDGKCTFSQREVNMDTRSFPAALKHVLRQDPDVILIGEMRDLETMSIALTAAETGHLILTTLHTPSSWEAIDRFVDAFPPSQHQQVRLQVSTTLQGIIYQKLVRRAYEGGVVPAVEVLIGTPAIRNLIREGKSFQMASFMHSGRIEGMQTLDQSLMDLYYRNIITHEEALLHSQNPENFARAE
jgi:twitching motility protein PilT